MKYEEERANLIFDLFVKFCLAVLFIILATAFISIWIILKK